MKHDDILDDEMIVNKKTKSPISKTRLGYNIFYSIVIMLHWAINIWWLNFAQKLNSTKHDIIEDKINLILFSILITVVLTLLGLMKNIRLYRITLILGILALIISFYLILGPILFYYDN